MTDIKLLPLPEEEWNVRYGYHADTVRDYARANVERHTAELQAEIEELRTEVAAQRTRADAMAGEVIKHEARAERLAEALHKLEEACDDSDGAQYGTLGTSFVRGICNDALLREQKVEVTP